MAIGIARISEGQIILPSELQGKSADISQRNRRAIELLNTWQREVPEYDAIWWDDFESELRRSRVTFRSNKK